jgi:hypothetical protein
LAETINGLYKAEVIHRRGPWRSFEAVEYATLECVDWFNHRRLLEPIGNIPPAEAEERYYAMLDDTPMQRNLNPEASDEPGAVQTTWDGRTYGITGQEIDRPLMMHGPSFVAGLTKQCQSMRRRRRHLNKRPCPGSSDVINVIWRRSAPLPGTARPAASKLQTLAQ